MPLNFENVNNFKKILIRQPITESYLTASQTTIVNEELRDSASSTKKVNYLIIKRFNFN